MSVAQSVVGAFVDDVWLDDEDPGSASDCARSEKSSTLVHKKPRAGERKPAHSLHVGRKMIILRIVQTGNNSLWELLSIMSLIVRVQEVWKDVTPSI